MKPGCDRLGQVVEVREGTARLSFGRQQSCSGCARGHGCGLGPIISLFRGSRTGTAEIHAPAGGLRVGDRVRVVISGSRLVQAVVLAYLLPMTTMFAGAVGASALGGGQGDIPAVFGAGAGLLVGWAYLRYFCD